MKRIILMITTILSIFFVCLVTAYASNEINIDKYNNGEYEKNMFAIFGFTQPYVEHYNMGNNYYRQGEYEMAIEEYNKALEKHPPHSHYNDKSYNSECHIRINIVLSMLAEINVDKIADEDISGVLQTLEEAKGILSEKGCAENENTGHNEDAIQLYKDICELEEELKNRQGESEESDDDKKDDKDDSQDEKDDGSSDARVQEILDNQKDGTTERNKTLEETRELYEDGFSFYDGEIW